MSKMDNLRAMREAKYERNSTQPARRATAPPVAARPRTASPEVPDARAGREAEQELCGHRAISGRTCTRERGHSAKSHRYG